MRYFQAKRSHHCQIRFDSQLAEAWYHCIINIPPYLSSPNRTIKSQPLQKENVSCRKKMPFCPGYSPLCEFSKMRRYSSSAPLQGHPTPAAWLKFHIWDGPAHQLSLSTSLPASHLPTLLHCVKNVYFEIPPTKSQRFYRSCQLGINPTSVSTCN